MKISSIIDIVQGNLQNNPAISFITQKHTILSKVNDGDLFISSSLQDIKSAINKGAFAIIYDINLDESILDNEIAFIKVDSINEAIVKIIRFSLINKNIKSYFTDEVSIDIIKNLIMTRQNVIILNNNLKDNFEKLKSIDHNITILSSDKLLLFNINPKTKIFKIIPHTVQNLIINSLFETTFSFNDRYFYKLKLSYVYINNFINVFNFLEENNFKYDINKINSIKYMHPIFINKNANIIEFGKSNQFILSNNIKKTVQNELNFIKKYYRYGSLMIIDGYCSDDTLFQKIKNNTSNAIYIINRANAEIINLLNKNIANHTKLF